MKRSKAKLKKEDVAIRMRLRAEVLRQANRSEEELQIAHLLEDGAQRIEELEVRLRNRSTS